MRARPLPFHAENNVDLAAMIGANLVLFAAIILGRRLVIGRWEAGGLLACYLAYLGAGSPGCSERRVRQA